MLSRASWLQMVGSHDQDMHREMGCEIDVAVLLSRDFFWRT